MKHLTDHEYFTNRLTNDDIEEFVFNEAEFEICIDTKRHFVWWNSPFSTLDENPNWFKELYARTFLDVFEKRKMKLLLGNEMFKSEPFIEIVRCKAILCDIPLPNIEGGTGLSFPSKYKEQYNIFLNEASEMVGIHYFIRNFKETIHAYTRE